MNTPEVRTPDVSSFNALSGEEARTRLHTCLNVPRWVQTVAAGRPYADWESMARTARSAASHLDEVELVGALAGHPRIGEKASSPDHDAEMSRREQGGVDPGDTEVLAQIVRGNYEYEATFDRVFLIRAAGRSAPEIRDELTRRLGNDAATEREETVAQLREIALLRLETIC